MRTAARLTACGRAVAMIAKIAGAGALAVGTVSAQAGAQDDAAADALPIENAAIAETEAAPVEALPESEEASEAGNEPVANASVASEPAAADPASSDIGEDEMFASDLGFMHDCLDTLAARGAPARACVGIVERNCAGEPGAETTAGAAACASRENAVWRGLLDETVAVVDASLSNAERQAFGRAQDAWSSYRDAECAYEAALYESGGLAEAERAACEGRLTAQRTLGLRERQAEVEERLEAR